MMSTNTEWRRRGERQYKERLAVRLVEEYLKFTLAHNSRFEVFHVHGFLIFNML